MLAQLGFVPYLDELVRSAARAPESTAGQSNLPTDGDVVEPVLDFGHIQVSRSTITRLVGESMLGYHTTRVSKFYLSTRH